MSTAAMIEIAAAFGILVVGGFGFGWFRILKETNKLLREQNDDLKSINKSMEKKHQDNVARINKLEGQQEVLMNIPLRQIAEHMEAQTQLMQKLIKMNGHNKK